MRFVTRQGTVIETLEVAGHSTPYLLKGWYHIHLVVTPVGQTTPVHCEPMQIMQTVFDRDKGTMTEDDFWEQTAADALTNQQAMDAYRKAGRNADEANRLLGN